MYVVESPCCGRRVLVERWELAYAEWWSDGRIQLRCGSVLDKPGWRRARDRREGCGETSTMDVAEVKVRHS
jgi:hypothetical protein